MRPHFSVCAFSGWEAVLKPGFWVDGRVQMRFQTVLEASLEIRMWPPTDRRVKDATRIAIEVVKKVADQVGFQVLPRRWAVERLFAWINRNRRLAKDFERTVASAETFLYAVSVMFLTRLLVRST